ncbi:RNA polymerase II transcription factor B 52 kDa subunit [Elasticomyces elasticus]|nr:RNA polymerase II transcription factor B 52 kDa subunit [Elasticomyces elasticus]
MSSTASLRALDYLEQLPTTTFNKLYTQPSTCLAIFRRMLPHLAKTLVLSLLYMPSRFPTTSLDIWVKPDADSISAKDRALSILQRLRILSEVQDAGRPGWKLSEAFSHSLKQALTGGGNHRSFGVPCSTVDKTPVTISYLDTFARNQWEAILYYVVGSAHTGLGGRNDTAAISPGTQRLLQNGGFVALRNRQAHITQSGFTFLLQEINAQIWTLLIVYLEESVGLGMEPVDVLSFLFTLGSLELGISYSTTNLTQTQTRMLEDLSDFGIIYQNPSDTTRYYPTRLATTLTSDAPALPSDSSLTTVTTTTTAHTSNSSGGEKGYIILETNYRLYAYTSSPLLISILSLFTSLRSRYPNLVTAKLTKTSIQSAIQLGITSDQIISYLTTHAHPLMRAQSQAAQGSNSTAGPILPPTVVDQIRLWQLEGERMISTPGFLIKDVGSPEDFEKAVAYAEALGVLKKSFGQGDGKGRQWFFVTRMDQMSGYFKAQAGRRKEERERRERELGGGGGGVKREG